jgi:hypothetical protein
MGLQVPQNRGIPSLALEHAPVPAITNAPSQPLIYTVTNYFTKNFFLSLSFVLYFSISLSFFRSFFLSFFLFFFLYFSISIFLSFLVWPRLFTHCTCIRLLQHVNTHTHIRWGSSGRAVSPAQRPLRVQHPEEKSTHAPPPPGGIRARSPSK